MTVDELLKQQGAALEAEDIAKARELLEEIKAEVDKENAWNWLRSNEPKSYPQLIEKLQDASERLSASGKTELGQLVKVFEWCRDHEITLAELEVSDHLHKYREAAACLNRIRDSDEPDQSKVREMREAIDSIKSHSSRKATRKWARSQRKDKAEG